jgi:Protein of unknown function (DUF2934)
VHVYRHGHTAAVYAFHCTNLRELTRHVLRRTFAPKEVPHECKSPEEVASDRDRRTTRARTPDPPSAQELYEARGREDGHELDDWLRAEAEIMQKKAGTIAA